MNQMTKSQYQMAHFKFALIAPVIQETYPDDSAIAYYRRITENPLQRPDGTTFHYKPKSVQYWEQLYRKGGMDALVRPPRKDKGTTRSLSNDAIAEIYRLKEKFPRLNAVQIREKLLADGTVTAKISARCFQRFIKEWNLRNGTPVSMKERKAFEEAILAACGKRIPATSPLLRIAMGCHLKHISCSFWTTTHV